MRLETYALLPVSRGKSNIFRDLTYYKELWLKVHHYQVFQSGFHKNVL